MKKSYDAAEVKQACSNHIKAIIADLYPAAKTRGAEARIGSISGEAGTSMAISLSPSKFGAFFDHESSEHGDIITILEAQKGFTYGQALEWLAENYTKCVPQEYEFKKTSEIPTLSLAGKVVPLSQECIDYAQIVRGVDEKVLKRYGVQTSVSDPNVLCFIHHHDGQPTKIAYSSTVEKKYWANPGCGSNLFGTNYCTATRAKGKLIITEGQWDALSWAQLGFHAVSIPSGVSNTKWIDEDWEYLKEFHTIHLSFDMDEPGQEATEEAVKRLGIHKCKIIRLPEKDASDCLMMGKQDEMVEAYNHAETPPDGELVPAEDLKEATRKALQQNPDEIGDPYFIPNFNIRIREYEMTLIFGTSFHGKSQFISNQVAFDASNQIATVIASFEQQSTMTMASLVKQYCANANIGQDNEAFDRAYDDIAPFITIYDSNTRTDPKKLIDSFIYAHKRKGINRFVVDNVMSLESDRDDNNQQAGIAHLFREFTKNYPVHLFVIAHPRKARSDEDARPPRKSDIRGASEWGDVPENVITVWRNERKEEEMNTLRADGRDEYYIKNQMDNTPDGQIFVRKQRLTGKTPQKRVWFEQNTQRFMTEPGIPESYIRADTEPEKEEDPF